MDITKEKLIEELNKDLEWEYAAAVQYVQHAAMIKGAQYKSMQEELLLHSKEEMQHAAMISEQVEFLGGVPTIQIEEREISDESITMLEQDLKGEETAITRYKERIRQAEELGEYGLRRILEDILIQEEEHKRDLLDALEI